MVGAVGQHPPSGSVYEATLPRLLHSSRSPPGRHIPAVQQHADELLGTWREVVAGEELDEEQEDRLDELEAWIEASDENG
jgi:hypothetical protein